MLKPFTNGLVPVNKIIVMIKIRDFGFLLRTIIKNMSTIR